MRCHSWSSLATVSARMPVSRSSVRAAFAVGATANTTRPCAWRSSAAAVSMRVLPAPAGPTTSTSRSSPATAAAASACNGSRPSSVDRGRRGGRVGLGGHRPREDRFLLGEHRLGREPGCGRFDPHRPAIRAAPGGVAGRVEVDELAEDLVGRSLQRLGPAGVPTAATRDVAGRRSPAARRPATTTTAAATPRRSRPATMSASAGTASAAASSMLASSSSAVQPASAASVCHRVVRSAAP